jgi:replication factor A1
MSLEDHAEELASDLGVDKEEVKDDLENLVSYSVPMDEAKDSLRRKYGDGSESGSTAPSTKQIAEITTADSNVSVTAVVLTCGKRSIRYQGEDQVIFEGELADESGKLSYTAWEDVGLEVGQTIRLDNVGVREWDGHPELNIGQSTTVSLADEEIDVSDEIGGDESLSAIEPGDRGINVEVTVLEREQKTIDGRDGETEILSGVLADETARLPYTDWQPRPELTEGASVRIEDVFIREFRGVPSVNVSEFSTVTALDREVQPQESAPKLSIGEAVDSGGLFDVELVGNAIALRDGSGLIERCPECGRVIQNGQCRSHGEVEGEDDLRTKIILDDGTGTATAVLDEELTAQVYGGDIAAAKEHAREEMDKEVVAETIADDLVGREFRVRGSLSVDEYGANLEAVEFTENSDDPATRAEQLLAEVQR